MPRGRGAKPAMKGIRPHTHADRQKVIDEMVPLVRRKFGKNLVAFAACASFARGEDDDYSDLELVAILRRMPSGKEWGGMAKVRDGLMVELVWMTEREYIARTLEVGDDWYIAASDRLEPIIDDAVIGRLNDHRAKNLRRKCLDMAARHWYEVQESTAKVLNAVKQRNRDGIPLLVCDMYLHMLRVLSFLNQTPYVTFSRFVSQARGFALKPRGFDALTCIVVDGKFQERKKLVRTVEEVFAGFEEVFKGLGYDLYYEDVDPSMPEKRWMRG